MAAWKPVACSYSGRLSRDIRLELPDRRPHLAVGLEVAVDNPRGWRRLLKHGGERRRVLRVYIGCRGTGAAPRRDRPVGPAHALPVPEPRSHRRHP